MTAQSRTAPPPPWVILSALVLANLFAKGAFIGINSGEYTDGILQLHAWEHRYGLYPPLYEFAARFIALAGLPLETAARIISVIAGSLCVIPVCTIARKLGGRSSAAIFAGLLYTLAPMPWRWSVRVMTDTLFLLLSTGAMAALASGWSAQRGFAASPARSARLLAVAVLLAGLAGFTRYQGALLAPLLALVFFLHVKRFRRMPWLSAALAVAFAAAAAWWVSVNQQTHAGQFASRTAGTPLATALAWINNAESFLLISPYYMGYPIFAAALLGIATVRRRADYFAARPAAVLWGAYAIMLLALQSAFGSFQYRYMMPLMPFVCSLAGVGFSAAEEWSATRRFRIIFFKLATLLSLLYLAAFSLAVLVLQRETYGDQREAASFLRKNIPATTPVFSNERYGNYVNFGSVKLSNWSGRPVKVLLSPDQPMPAGSVVVLGTAYGGDAAVGAMLAELQQRYTLQPLTPALYRSQIVPLMDDIMTNPMFNQNPLAWVLRYVPQDFATQIYRIQPRSAGAPHGA